eukprot:7330223-Pyramimonas_sp.AAC.1
MACWRLAACRGRSVMKTTPLALGWSSRRARGWPAWRGLESGEYFRRDGRRRRQERQRRDIARVGWLVTE